MSVVVGYYVVTILAHFLDQINEAHSQERIIRSSIRSMLENQLSPDFYPTRGRRAKASSGEEEEPPFWAQRGRSLDVLTPNWPRNVELSSSNNLEDMPFWSAQHQSSGSGEEAPFWASRGRALAADAALLKPVPSVDCIDPSMSLSYAEEPRVVVIERRDNSDEAHSSSSNFWASRGRRDQFGRNLKHAGKIFGGNTVWKRNTVKLASNDEKRLKYEDNMQHVLHKYHPDSPYH
uniref:Uncharacterized protein n=1 Tax=Cacopsylla melanoneura TaxID=428564 RepID=A0A8D9E1Z4_9HEMI